MKAQVHGPDTKGLTLSAPSRKDYGAFDTPPLYMSAAFVLVDHQ